MISSLRGIVQAVAEGSLVLEVGGVGLYVAAPSTVLERVAGIGKPLFLHTHLIVREDALRLFGFSSLEERAIFIELLQVSGLGPRTALAILSTMSIDTLRLAVAGNQAEALVRVPGVGKKTAEKIIFQLKDRIAPLPLSETPPSQPDNELMSVLTALGYSLMEAQSAIRSLEGESTEDVEQRIKLALQYFARP
ncbi:MAG: Holliday junction branch migration protein RuvA [Anaerolineales bacterium]